MDELIRFLSAHPVVLGDGAMGTMLQAAGLTTGGSPEKWNVTQQEVLKGICRAYADIGAQIITTDAFGCNRFRLRLHYFEDRVGEFNLAAVKTAREVAAAADHDVLMAGDMGPTGEILFPLGTRMPDEVRDAFAEQAAALA